MSCSGTRNFVSCSDALFCKEKAKEKSLNFYNAVPDWCMRDIFNQVQMKSVSRVSMLTYYDN